MKEFFCFDRNRNLPGVSTNMAMEVTGASSADGAEVQIWTYYDSESQMKWVFEEASTVGNGGPYTEHTSSSYNCMSYALKYYQSWLTPTGYELGDHLAEAKAGVISRAKELGIPIREIGEDDVLNPQKEFRIAFRVACHKKVPYSENKLNLQIFILCSSTVTAPGLTRWGVYHRNI